MAGMRVGVAIGLLAGLPGCVGWDTWPPVEPGDSIPARDDATVTQTMTAALARVIQDYPPRGEGVRRVAINLPEPLVSPAVYRKVARDIEREIEEAYFVVPLDEASMDLPIYHIAGVRPRTSTAEVDVLRPVFGPGQLDRSELTNDEAYEGYRVRLSGGFRPWHVKWVDRFSPGIISAPALNPIDRQRPAARPEPADEPGDQPAAGVEPGDDATEAPAEMPAEDPGQG